MNNRYRNPKNIRQEVKLFFFYLLDLAFVAGCTVFGFEIASKLPLNLPMKFALDIISLVFGVWCCIRTKAHPKERNVLMLYYMFKMDKNRYHTIQFERNKKGKVKI